MAVIMTGVLMTRLANTALDATVAGYLIGGLALLGVFVLIECRVAEPMLPLSIFRVPTMSASLLAAGPGYVFGSVVGPYPG